MNLQELETMCQERRLIKELIRLDKARYNYLELRSQEIKIKINSEYTPFVANYVVLYDANIAQRITMSAVENLQELLQEQK